MGEPGREIPQDTCKIDKRFCIVGDCRAAIPEAARACLNGAIEALIRLIRQFRGLDQEIARRAVSNELSRRLMTVPRIGPLIATALVAPSPPLKKFRRDRDFAAWLGLAPMWHSTGGKLRHRSTTKIRERLLWLTAIVPISCNTNNKPLRAPEAVNPVENNPFNHWQSSWATQLSLIKVATFKCDKWKLSLR